MAPGDEIFMKRTEYLVYFLGFLDLFGVSMMIPLLPKFARELGASPTITGIVGSLYGSLQLFSSPMVGRWSDSVGIKPVLINCLALSACGYFMMGLASSVFFLLLSRIPTGLFKHSQELNRNYLSKVLPSSHHSVAFGRFNAFSSLGFILGPLVGGHMTDMKYGYHAIVMTTATLFFLSSLIAWLFLPATSDSLNSPETNSKNKNVGLSLRQYFQDLKKVNWSAMWDLFAVRILLSLAVMIYRSNFSLMLDYRFGASGKVTGYIISYSGVVGMLSGFLIGKISSFYSSDAKLMVHSSLLQLASLTSMIFAPSLAIFVVCMTPLSLANAISRVSVTKVTLQRGKGQDVGLLLGLGASSLSISRMISFLIGGVAQDLHVSGPSIVSSITAAAGVAVMLCGPHDWLSDAVTKAD